MSIVSIRKKIPLPKKVWNFFWNLVVVPFAFIPLMVFNACQYPSLLLRPFSRKAYWGYNRIWAYLNWGWWAYALQHLVGITVEFLGDDVPPAENAIVIANHQTMGDIPVMLCLALAKDRVGDLKWLVKDVLKYVPGVGWGLVFLDALFLKRKWADDQDTVTETFQRYVSMKTPLWLVMYPEGTRANNKKLAEHRASPAKEGEIKTHYVLRPRAKGFAASVQGLQSVIGAIYDLTIVYPGDRPPTLMEIMRGEVSSVKIFVRRFRVEDVPKDSEGLRAWLLRIYQEKDQIIRAEKMKAV